MKQFLSCVLIVCGLTSAFVIAADKPLDKEKKPPVPATQPVAAINKFCAVDKENPVDPTVPTVTYEGKVIGFCCEDCAPKFKKDPKKYMKDLK